MFVPAFIGPPRLELQSAIPFHLPSPPPTRSGRVPGAQLSGLVLRIFVSGIPCPQFGRKQRRKSPISAKHRAAVTQTARHGVAVAVLPEASEERQVKLQ